MQVRFHRVDWEFATPFRISYRTRTHAQTMVVELESDDVIGRGEGIGVSYHGETIDSLMQQLTNFAPQLSNGVSRDDLQHLLPPGGARNAIDCALWDLEAKRSGCRAWELAGLSRVKELVTAYTLGVDTPEATARAAADRRQYPLIKIKLTGDHDLDRVALVRKARPDASIVVDANQSWDERALHELTPQLAELRVQLIEQPLAVGKDGILENFDSPIPICADESCQTVESLPELRGKYRFVNIKLDKTGGLTEALRLAESAKRLGFGLMVGCMAGSSLSMAPAFIVGQLCEVVDLDGPLLARTDIANGIRYQGGRMSAPTANLWG